MGEIAGMLPRTWVRFLAALLLAVAIGAGAISPARAETATRTSSFEYDPATGLLIDETIEPDQAAFTLKTTYSYDGFGNKLSGTAGQGLTARTSSSTYDTKGRFPLTNTNVLGHQDVLTYDARFGAPLSQKGPNNLTTTWQYDSFGRKTLEIRADGTKTSWSYQFCAGVNGGTQSCAQPGLSAYVMIETPLAVNDTPNGPVKKTYYDRLNRVTGADTEGFDGTPIRTITEYDAHGRQKRVSKPHFLSGTVRWVTTTYDTLGRPDTVTQPDNSQSTFAYNGLTSIETNSLGQDRITVKNARDLTVRITDDMGGITKYTHDAFDNLTSIEDPAGSITTMSYDIRGRKITDTDPDMGEWFYEYNAFGELVGETDAKGQVTSITYDLLGRMVQRVEPGLTSNWEYGTSSANKNIGKLVRATTSTGYERVHTYDGLGRPSGTAITFDNETSTFTASYDAHSRLSQVLYPSGLAVQYVYTNLGYLQQLKDTWGVVLWTANAYDAEMNLLRQTAGNNIETRQAFDEQTGFLEGITAAPNNAVANLAYVYDSVGNVLSRSDSRQIISGSQSIYESFDYDDLNRLTDYSVFGGTSKHVTYDLTGNILSKSDVGVYTYGPTGGVGPHAVQSIAGTLSATYLYDANGNMTSGGGRTLTWTSFNMPATISRGASTVSFAYNGEHERIKQAQGSQSTYYLNDAASGVMTEKLKNGTEVRWNDYLMADGKLVGVRHTLPDLSTRTRFFVADHLGSISVITDELQQVVERLSFDPWGKRRFDAGWADDPIDSLAGLNTTRGFTGHEHLDSVGLVHMNARVYDPLIGRFLSADPTIQNPTDSQTLNRYHYARNNPLAFVDPSGYGFFSFFKKLFSKVFKFLFKTALGRTLLALAATITFQYWAIALQLPGIVGAVIGGAVGGAITSGSLEGALIGAVTAAAFYGVGSATGMHDAGLSDFLTGRHLANVMGHAAVGCGSAVAQGGKCGPSALAGAMTSFSGPLMAGMNRVAGTIASAALGGATAVVGGGKFQNGAITGAFGYLYNQAASDLATSDSEIKIPRFVPDPENVGCLTDGTSYFCVMPSAGMVRAVGPRLLGLLARSRSFATFDAFKSAWGSAGRGQHWHHIVEQNGSNLTKFGANKIHSIDNIVSIPAGVNLKLNGLYSSVNPQVTGSATMTVREWLKPQSFEAQFDFGVKMMKQVGGF
jgi:RHS repeat-associated protein